MCSAICYFFLDLIGSLSRVDCMVKAPLVLTAWSTYSPALTAWHPYPPTFVSPTSTLAFFQVTSPAFFSSDLTGNSTGYGYLNESSHFGSSILFSSAIAIVLYFLLSSEIVLPLLNFFLGDYVARVFRSVWKTNNVSEITELSQNFFLIKPTSAEAQTMILNRPPWVLDDDLFSIVAYNPAWRVADFEFTRMVIWVRVFQLPLHAMNSTMGLRLGGCIGRAVAIDHRVEGGNLGEFLRIRVEIDITKPLRRFVLLGNGQGKKPTPCPLRYERLPNFCFFCGLVGHLLLSCPTKPTVLDERKLQYGEWMRVHAQQPRPGPRKRQGAEYFPTPVATGLAPESPAPTIEFSSPPQSELHPSAPGMESTGVPADLSSMPAAPPGSSRPSNTVAPDAPLHTVNDEEQGPIAATDPSQKVETSSERCDAVVADSVAAPLAPVVSAAGLLNKVAVSLEKGTATSSCVCPSADSTRTPKDAAGLCLTPLPPAVSTQPVLPPISCPLDSSCKATEGPTRSTKHTIQGKPSPLWKSLKSLPTLPKVRIFAWRLAHDCLPTGSRVVAAGLGSGVCPFCSTTVETSQHAFRDCPSAAEALHLGGFPISVTDSRVDSIFAEPLDS
ncbi:hypothetical protein V6N11_025441 [Hibiscus sabdariffa]|uniref:CCHC-type domain-containing protein n=1 Tax=Hibiscus sabdariffa TaxID=183260 RepID=A0ABR2NA89_9ROSI